MVPKATEHRKRWIDRINPTHAAVMIIAGTFMAGVSTAVFGLDAYRMPRENRTLIESHEQIGAHPEAADRIGELERTIGQLVCLQVAEKDAGIPWESCVQPDLLNQLRQP